MNNHSNPAFAGVSVRESETDRPGLEEIVPGELYLYHRDDRSCPSESSLWGVVAWAEDGVVCLETSSRDLFAFRFWHFLPSEYLHARLATRAELRDYAAGLSFFECRAGKRLPAVPRPRPFRNDSCGSLPRSADPFDPQKP
ncbi:hypothetical protein [uncultured Alistipes sp.]|uniref:hypothetical protein n=1 Tax=uncultured Alistipes sp. TaxID=538949 RepID=UPI0026384D4C|nr:hypothetical protein [uncultured Alistipes sp.]